METPKTLIIGVGNTIFQDEGVGMHAVHDLQKEKLPPGVELIEAETSILDYLPQIQSAEKIVIIDALRTGAPPGTIYRLTPEKLPVDAALSLHAMGPLQVIQLARQAGDFHAEVIIIGIEPKEMEMGMELTPEVKARLPKIVETVLNELKGG
ncbi:MAG: hydrogenase maturation protease [Proteobacteria bacterium]|nr:hydrogenase maturation protease [Pseudomonadota bacterium]